jgi:hypothetical protein
VGNCSPLEHGTEAFGGFREKLSGTPVQNHSELAHDVQHVELSRPVARRYRLWVLIKPALSFGTYSLTLAISSRFVDFVLGQFGIDLTYHNAVVLAGPLD